MYEVSQICKHVTTHRWFSRVLGKLQQRETLLWPRASRKFWPKTSMDTCVVGIGLISLSAEAENCGWLVLREGMRWPLVNIR